MNYISFNKGAKQVSNDYAAKLAQFPAGTLLTEWHRGDDATKALLDTCAARGNKLLIQADDWPTQRTRQWVERFIATHAAHPAFAGWYFDEPGLKVQTIGAYQRLLDQLHVSTEKATVAVFGLLSETQGGWAGRARVEGVDNYWDDESRPKSREDGWKEYTEFLDSLLTAHARTNYAGEYVSVPTCYAAGDWHAVAEDMQRTREYLRVKAGDRLTTTMLYASVIDGGHERGYMDDAPTLAEVQRFVATPYPPEPAQPNTLTVKLKKGQRLIVETE